MSPAEELHVGIIWTLDLVIAIATACRGVRPHFASCLGHVNKRPLAVLSRRLNSSGYGRERQAGRPQLKSASPHICMKGRAAVFARGTTKLTH
jgi:hypothetical protein